MQNKDLPVLRELAARYLELSTSDDQRRRRDLWRRHNSFERTPPLIYVRAIPWAETPALQVRECEDPFYAHYESWFRLMLCHGATGDDFTFAPWVTVGASVITPPHGLWGLEIKQIPSPTTRGSWMYDPPIKELADREKLIAPHHVIDEEATARNVAKLQDAIGDIIPVIVDRAPAYRTWNADIANNIAYLRGLEQVMWDMMDNPEWLHGLLAFMRDGILTVHDEAETAGDWRLCNHENQAMPYARELPDPSAAPSPVTRDRLWTFVAAQEYAAVSPAMHDEFLLQYQLPIMKKFGLVSYGCCEDLSEKIDMLRQIPNLRRIAVTPRANVRRCAEQIGSDYIFSYRPNPAEMVSFGFEPDHIRKVIRETLETARGCHVDITLKDVETVQYEPERLRKWVEVVRSVSDDFC